MKQHVRAYFLSWLFFITGCEKCTSKTSVRNPQSSSSANVTAESSPQKIFSFVRSSDPKTFDPQGQLDSESAMFVNAVYDTLLGYHYLKRPYELTPKLLARMPETKTEDPLTYVFELKPGILFADDDCFPQGKGRELTVDDVFYTLKRFADINVNTKSWFFLEGVIKGLDEFREQTKALAGKKIAYDDYQISGFHKIDRYRFELTITHQNPLFLYTLAVSSTSIIPKEAVDTYGDQFQFHPVGTGPFVIKKFEKKQTAILSKSHRYFETYPQEGDKDDEAQGLLASKGAKLPLLDEIHLLYIPEAQPAMLQFLDHNVDWLGLDRDNFIKMAKKEKDGTFLLNEVYRKDFQIYSEPSLSVTYYLINMKDALLGQNKKLRQALAYALDVEGQLATLANGRGEKLHSLVPMGIKGSEKDIGTEFSYSFDLARAKALLAEAGFPEGKGLPPLTMMLSNTSSSATKGFEFLRDNFSKIGVILKPEYKTWSKYLQDVEGGNYQIASSAWTADYPDPENFYQLFYGPNKAPGSNHSGFDHPEFNTLYTQMRFMENGPERQDIIRKMAKIFQEEVPAILDYGPTVVGLTQNRVRNFKRNMMNDTPFQYLDVAMTP